MRKLIVSEFVTLDGVIEAPGGEPTHPHTGWVMPFATPEQEECKFPVVVGGGLRLFPDGRVKSSFTLAGSRTFPTGVVEHTYHLAA